MTCVYGKEHAVSVCHSLHHGSGLNNLWSHVFHVELTHAVQVIRLQFIWIHKNMNHKSIHIPCRSSVWPCLTNSLTVTWWYTGDTYAVSEALEALNDMARSAILQQNCRNQLTVGTNIKALCESLLTFWNLKFGLSTLESDETFWASKMTHKLEFAIICWRFPNHYSGLT